MKKLIPQSLKNIYHLFQAVFANARFGFPSRRLKVIGVTGTNGKTTTVQMIAKILEEAKFKIAVASTINFKLVEKEWVNKSKFTTLSSWALQKFLREAVAAECDYAVLEVSSHSLDQNRAWGVEFNAAVITNVTREHLDYHKTMEEYAKVKSKLFAGLGKSGKEGKSAAIINLNTDFAEIFLKYKADKKYGYALKFPISKSQFPTKSQIQNYKIETIIAEEIELGIDNSKFKIQNSKFFLNMPGEFNIENALAAACVGLSQEIAIEKISAALAKIEGVPGRMEKIENNRNLDIIVDYAVTPDSLEKLYAYLNGIKKNYHSSKPHPVPLLVKEREKKIIAVFGSCGERDRGKRPIMGEIVARLADYIMVTNEEPYHEDPQQIIDDVFAGVAKHKKENENTWRILDRREAIKKALQIAKPGDIVVVTGMGAEDTMAVGNERIPWNDPEVIREVLREQE